MCRDQYLCTCPVSTATCKSDRACRSEKSAQCCSCLHTLELTVGPSYFSVTSVFCTGCTSNFVYVGLPSSLCTPSAIMQHDATAVPADTKMRFFAVTSVVFTPFALTPLDGPVGPDAAHRGQQLPAASQKHLFITASEKQQQIWSLSRRRTMVFLFCFLPLRRTQSTGRKLHLRRRRRLLQRAPASTQTGWC